MSSSSSSAWTLIAADNPVFRNYAVWTGVLVLKTLGMSALTAIMRFKNHTFANPEDTILHKVAVKYNDEEVERVRRAHRNDLENVLPLIIVGFVYVLTDPSAECAIHLYQAAAISRIVHTIVYAVFVVPQPARAIAWFVPWIITGHMACQIVQHFW